VISARQHAVLPIFAGIPHLCPKNPCHPQKSAHFSRQNGAFNESPDGWISSFPAVAHGDFSPSKPHFPDELWVF
jgi:hypothetical protein